MSVLRQYYKMRQGEKAKRLASIILMLRTSRSQTAVELAEALGVTVRTVYRDLDNLAAAGIPVRGTPGPAGGYELAEHYPVDPFVYVQADPQPILVGKADTVSASKALDTAVSLFADGLPESARSALHRVRQRFLFDTSAWLWKDSSLATFADLKQAVLNDQRVEVVFVQRGNTNIRHEELDPYGLVWRQGHWYLVAHSAREARFVRHRVQRLLGIRPTGKTFKRQRGFDLSMAWGALLDAFGRGTELVRFKIDFPATQDFEAFDWKSDQIIHKADDPWVVEMRVDNDEWLIPLALSYGDEFQILEPQRLRHRVAAALKAALEKYKDTDVPAIGPEDRTRSLRDRQED